MKSMLFCITLVLTVLSNNVFADVDSLELYCQDQEKAGIASVEDCMAEQGAAVNELIEFAYSTDAICDINDDGFVSDSEVMSSEECFNRMFTVVACAKAAEMPNYNNEENNVITIKCINDAMDYYDGAQKM